MVVLWGARRNDSHYAFVTRLFAVNTRASIAGNHAFDRDIVTIIAPRDWADWSGIHMRDRRYQPNALELAATAIIRLVQLPGRIRRLFKP